MRTNGVCVERTDADVAEVRGDLAGSDSEEGPDFGLRSGYLSAWLMQELHLRFVSGQKVASGCQIGIAVEGYHVCGRIARDVV